LALERAMLRARLDADLGGMCGLDESSSGQIDVRTLTRLSTFGRVVTATDPDAAGDRVASEVAHALRRTCDVVRLELPEGQDACDVTPDELQQRLVHAICAA
jgi:Toprim-like